MTSRTFNSSETFLMLSERHLSTVWNSASKVFMNSLWAQILRRYGLEINARKTVKVRNTKAYQTHHLPLTQKSIYQATKNHLKCPQIAFNADYGRKKLRIVDNWSLIVKLTGIFDRSAGAEVVLILTGRRWSSFIDFIIHPVQVKAHQKEKLAQSHERTQAQHGILLILCQDKVRLY